MSDRRSTSGRAVTGQRDHAAIVGLPNAGELTRVTRRILYSAGVALSLLVPALAKVDHPQGFQWYVQSSLSVPSAVASAIAWAITGIEFAVALLALGAVLRPALSRAVGVVGVILAVTFAVSAIIAERGQSCGCFGRLVEATRAWRFVFAGALLYFSAALCALAPSEHPDEVGRG